MTRLTAADIRPLRHSLEDLDGQLRAVTKLGLGQLAARAAGVDPSEFRGLRVAVVPVSAGQGTIPGFVEAVSGVLLHIGAEPYVTTARDVAGLAEALDGSPDAVYMADDEAFIALSPRHGACARNGCATGIGYAQALHEACGGVDGRRVLVVGLGPVGVSAAKRLSTLGADVWAVEVAAERVHETARDLPPLRHVELADGLVECDLILDASPASEIIPDEWVRPGRIVSAPGIPLGLTSEAAQRLGSRLIHEPLAIGVAVMLALLLVRQRGGGRGAGDCGLEPVHKMASHRGRGVTMA